ncbi:hypothetical protein EON81_06835 [bacterium]|nr:MAG: hypothetical protein EON81_06835 [bacterium]
MRIETDILAPPDVLFDLALDLEVHAKSAAETGERIVETSAAGTLRIGDTVTFEARHFGLRWQMTARITEYERPRRFVDEQQRGPFRSFRHEHLFEPVNGGTRMTDIFTFQAPFGPISEPILARHLARFLTGRARYLRQQAPSRSNPPKPPL